MNEFNEAAKPVLDHGEQEQEPEQVAEPGLEPDADGKRGRRRSRTM